jgi:transcriptional regulator with XRE-family HTH domain
MGNILDSESNATRDETDLAGRLVVLRRGKGLSLDQVALQTDISRATLSRIERAETSPTASVLGRLCAAYGLTMSQLLLGIEEDRPRLLPRADASRWLDPQTGFQRVSVSPPAKGYGIEMLLGELPSKAEIRYATPPVMGLEQHILLFTGELHLQFGEESFVLRPDDCLRVKLFGASRFFNPGPIPARYLIALGKLT